MPEFGLTMFPTDYSIAPAELAKEAEARGFDSLFFPEHTHIPASRESPWPGGPDLPKMYWHTLDPFVALGAAAAVTEKIKLATGICLVVERDPIQLAKEVASLDLVSNGRVIFGIGAGWNAEEMANHGVDFKKRWAVTREKILAMKTIWTEDEPEFHGEFVDFDPIWSWPKPVQAGGPPIWMGAGSKWTWDRVAEYCDGWMPILGRNPIDLTPLNQAMQAAGRAPGELDIALYGCPPKAEIIQQNLDIGINHIVFGLPSATREEVLPLLDAQAELMAGWG